MKRSMEDYPRRREKWGGTSQHRPMLTFTLRVRSDRDFGLEHVLEAEAVVGLVQEHVVGHALGEGELRLHHLLEERILVGEALGDDVPGLELLDEDRLRRADHVD